MLKFMEYVNEARQVNIGTDTQFLKALYDLEANIPSNNKASDYARQAAEYFDDTESVDQSLAELITKAVAALPRHFRQQALVDAIEDYVEENM